MLEEHEDHYLEVHRQEFEELYNRYEHYKRTGEANYKSILDIAREYASRLNVSTPTVFHHLRKMVLEKRVQEKREEKGLK
jgi:hypothetical protein